ncbi:IS3 family transposase [Cryobacterium sp. TMT3-29-2]|uniref:IS3 family transposase n=1 Tax=Cryobacterium sp. TMT3-29-2 TaxID=2555867 RepID=UPI003518FC5F
MFTMARSRRDFTPEYKDEAPRILADLRADGEIISRKTVATTMKRLGLVGICV